MSEQIKRYRMVRACLVTAPDACLFEHPMGKYAMWADCKAVLTAAQERIAGLEAKLKECREALARDQQWLDKTAAEKIRVVLADQPAEGKESRRGETADETIRRMNSAPRSQHVLDALRTACEAFHDGDDEATEKKEGEPQR